MSDSSTSDRSTSDRRRLWNRTNKVRLANQIRLAADNQRVLDLTHERERFATRLSQAVQLHQARKAGINVDGIEPTASEENKADEMDVNIDSPVTTTNHYTTNLPRGMSGKAKAALAAGVLALGGPVAAAGFHVASSLVSPPAQVAPAPSTPPPAPAAADGDFQNVLLDAPPPRRGP